MVMGETLALPETMRDEIVAHSRELAPRECCGVIVGPPGVPAELRRLTNLEPGVDRYLVDDAELYALSREVDERGWEFVVIYHSHPVSVAFPSKTDRELAFWDSAVYVICSLEHPDAPSLRAFRIVDDAVTEVELVEGDDAA